MNIFPNPANNFVNVLLESSNGDNVSYFVSDATGRMVVTPVTEFVEGQTIVQLDIDQLNSGMYFVTATSGNKTTTKPLQILK